MNAVWRFYVGEDRQWRWQRLSIDRVVLSESSSGYKHYEGCLANAQARGYVFHPSQDKLIRKHSR